MEMARKDVSSAVAYVTFEQLNVREMNQTMLNSQERGGFKEESAKGILSIFRGATDSFRRLPCEVLEYIQFFYD